MLRKNGTRCAKLDDKNIPSHVAVIMDGNGRWAKDRFLPRVAGHQAGMRALEDLIDNARDLGVRYLSVYAFSTENWKRSDSEVQGLMGLFRYYLKGKLDKMHRQGARVRFSGNMDGFPEDIREIAQNAETRTRENDAIDVIICVNYGGRQEIVDAAARLATSGEDITEESFKNHLYLPDVPDPDLLIRTGGEYRISNFLLWECAYAELYFSSVYWPDFDRSELERALDSYAGRTRRYGAA